MMPSRPAQLAAATSAFALLLASSWSSAQDATVPKPEVYFVPPGGMVVDPSFHPDNKTDDASDARTLYGFRRPGEVSADLKAKPRDHRGDFDRRHGRAARANPRSCTSCHTEASCRACHDRTALPSSVHPPGYTAFHAIDARRDASSCSSCHTPQTFCRDCHMTAREGFRGRSAPPGGTKFHPNDWTRPGDHPTRHGREARANLTTCTSCHTEADCVSCHVGVSPHPPGFIAKCGRLLARNPRVCTTCHTDTARLDTLCR